MGPLSDVKVIEIAGIGPGPFAAMLLSDLGADVVRVDRAQSVERGFDPGWMEVLNRGRRSIGVDLKQADGVETVLRMVEQADALIEGFRPGVAERLGIGPDTCRGRNPKLVYGRMTGWGQDGPYAQAAGHDINYISLAGALAHFGRAGGKPTPPMNVVGDFGGGGMLLAFGVACALLEARSSGEGQVVDAAMVDGSATLMAMAWGLRALGAFDEEHLGGNVLDTGAPFYDAYETADDKFSDVGEQRILVRRLLCQLQCTNHGVSRFSSALARSGAVDERHDQADQGKRLGEGEAQDHVAEDQVVRLRLTRDRLDAQAEDDADADTGADRGEAVTDRADGAGDLCENAHVLMSFARPVGRPTGSRCSSYRSGSNDQWDSSRAPPM